MTDSGKSTTRATLFILLSACCFGSITILISLAIARGAVLLDLLMWRYTIAAALLVIVSGGVGAVSRPGRRAVPVLALAGGGQAAIAFVSLSALKYIPAATLTFLFYTYPAWVAVISAVRGAEPLTARKSGALLLSLAGLALMIGTPGAGGLNGIGVSLALASAVLYALYIPMIDHFGKGISPAVTSSYAAAGAGLILLVAALTQGGPSISYSPSVWGIIALLAIPCTVVAFIMFLRGLAVIGPVKTAIMSTIEPFWTALLGSLLLNQDLGARTLVGGLLIASAVVVLQLKANA